ncbi:MAG: hypothetical protein DRH08_13225 [Deltaproteobacteria bacterium]|nr:MAG: hypothetical protein DRH08_13225 [Deltaproteobacteria bacterium]
MRTKGSPGNLGGPFVSTENKPANGGWLINPPRSPGAVLRVRGSEQESATVVPPSEGNEARREGREGVGAP